MELPLQRFPSKGDPAMFRCVITTQVCTRQGCHLIGVFPFEKSSPFFSLLPSPFSLLPSPFSFLPSTFSLLPTSPPSEMAGPETTCERSATRLLKGTISDSPIHNCTKCMKLSSCASGRRFVTVFLKSLLDDQSNRKNQIKDS